MCSPKYIQKAVPGIMENVPSARDYKPGFKVELIAKDLGISQSCASLTDAPTPMGALALSIYKAMTNNGHGERDFSYAYQFLLKKDLWFTYGIWICLDCSGKHLAKQTVDNLDRSYNRENVSRQKEQFFAKKQQECF
uniref:3-hydroxyisobutyrate dehydrogenase-like NAD-binding domain-containing protein n=1 Tax=Tetranychus urticae TaxID=32264 RepID=T1KPV4_TETUR